MLKNIFFWCLLALIWSSSYAFIKIGIQSIAPMTLVTGRILIAAGLLYLFMKYQHMALPSISSDWLHFVFIGAFGNVVPFFLISWGEIYVDSGLAAVMMGIAPVLTVLLAHILFEDERLNFSSLLGANLGVVGLIILVGIDVLSGIGKHPGGQLAILGAATCYAMTTLYVRKFVRLPAPIMATGSTIVGLFLIFPIALILEKPFTQDLPDLHSLYAMIYLGLFSTALANLIYFYLIPRIGAGKMSLINFVVPILGALIGIVWLEELFRWTMIAALLIVLAAIYLVNRRTGLSLERLQSSKQ